MKVVMTHKEKLAVEWAKKYKDWDKIIIAKDSYLEAYSKGREDAMFNIDGTKEVEIEFNNGNHQLLNGENNATIHKVKPLTEGLNVVEYSITDPASWFLFWS